MNHFEQRKQWRMSLKVGDEVVLRRGYHDTGSIVPVERVTETQIVINEHVRFRREDGRRVGGSHERFYTLSIEQPTDEAKARIRHKSLCAAMDIVKWEALPLETLEAIRALVTAAKKAP